VAYLAEGVFLNEAAFPLKAVGAFLPHQAAAAFPFLAWVANPFLQTEVAFLY